MEPFMVSCVDAYSDLSKMDRSSLKLAATPFLDEGMVAEDCAKDPEGSEQKLFSPLHKVY
eukprot:4055126-Heterocapsa_arctica.AAC.1